MQKEMREQVNATLNKSQIERDVNPQKDNLLQKIWDAKVVISLALIALLVRCTSYEAAPTQMVSTYEVSNRTEDFVNETVTVKSKVVKQVGLSSFTVTDQRFLSGEPILVINASGVPFDLPSDKNIKVQVVGVVRNLEIQDIERDYQLNLQDQDYKDYINKPALIARSILLAPTPGQITSNPRKFYGEKLAVTAEVDNIQSPVLFTLDENYLIGAQDLLVFLKAPPQATIRQNQRIEVIGELRPFEVNQIEKEYNVRWDLRVKRQLEADYRNKPVFIGDTVYP